MQAVWAAQHLHLYMAKHGRMHASFVAHAASLLPRICLPLCLLALRGAFALLGRAGALFFRGCLIHFLTFCAQLPLFFHTSLFLFTPPILFSFRHFLHSSPADTRG